MTPSIKELIETETMASMMKAKEKCMDIVMKADFYGIKSKANLVLFDKLVEQQFPASLKKEWMAHC